MKTVQMWLKVEEVDRIIRAFNDSKTSRRLNGRQRQTLEDALASLTELRSSHTRRGVQVPLDTAAQLLRCIGFIQEFLDDFFTDFGV
jgi:hypothetical protein